MRCSSGVLCFLKTRFFDSSRKYLPSVPLFPNYATNDQGWISRSRRYSSSSPENSSSDVSVACEELKGLLKSSKWKEMEIAFRKMKEKKTP